jgi:hypothetical protein
MRMWPLFRRTECTTICGQWWWWWSLCSLLLLLLLLISLPPQPFDPSTSKVKQNRHQQTEHYQQHRLRKLVDLLQISIPTSNRSFEVIFWPEIKVSVKLIISALSRPLKEQPSSLNKVSHVEWNNAPVLHRPLF